MLAVSAAQSPASEIDKAPLIVLGDDPSFEQLLSGTTGTSGEGLSPGLTSLKKAESAFPVSPSAPESALTDEVQSLLAQPGTEDRQIEMVLPNRGEIHPDDSRNTTVIHPMAGEVATEAPTHAEYSKSNLASVLGMKTNLSFSFHDTDPLGDDQESEPHFKAITLEAHGIATAILFALWSLMTVVVIMVHYKQKADQRRELAILQSYSWKYVQSVPKPLHVEERALQAQPDNFPEYGWRMKSPTANTNIDQGAAYAA
jgi:hypothetical protein